LEFLGGPYIKCGEVIHIFRATLDVEKLLKVMSFVGEGAEWEDAD
jgi:hypothetical protein